MKNHAYELLSTVKSLCITRRYGIPTTRILEAGRQLRFLLVAMALYTQLFPWYLDINLHKNGTRGSILDSFVKVVVRVFVLS
jgi:hypothetical protein